MDPKGDMIKAFESVSSEAKTSRSAGDSDEEKTKSSHSVSENQAKSPPHKLPSIPKRSKYFQKAHNTRESSRLAKKVPQKNSILKIPVIKEDDGLVGEKTASQKEESSLAESESQKSSIESQAVHKSNPSSKKKSSVSIRSLPFKKKQPPQKSPPITYCGKQVDESDIIGKTTFSSEEATEEVSTREATDEENTLTEVEDSELEAPKEVPISKSSTQKATMSSPVKQEYIQQTINQPNVGGTFFRPMGSKLANIPDYNSLSLVEQAHHRASFITRFNTLRRSWPDANIPFVDQNKSLEEIHAEYDTYINDIYVTKCVNKYKFWMVILWVGIEVVGRRMDLPMENYALTEYESMSDYDRLLIELGELNNQNVQLTVNGTAASNWPIEVQLVYNALYHAAGFLLLKFLTNYLPEGLGNTIIAEVKNIMGHNPAPKGPVQPVYLQQNGIPIQQSDQHGVPFMSQPIPEPNATPGGGLMDAINVPRLIATMAPNVLSGGKTDNASSQKPITEPKNTDPSRFQPMYAE